MDIQEANTDQEIWACWNVVFSLRPHLKQGEFLAKIREQQKEGYHLLFIPSSLVPGTGAAILGYRVQNYLYSGKTLYIDDLSTLATERGQGYGGKLLDHARKIAIETGCDQISLDSGYTRVDAHRLYLNKGFVLGSHHFVQKIVAKERED